MAAKLHPGIERKLANQLAWKLLHTQTFERGTPEHTAQQGWYNGFVSCLYTQYGIPVGDRIANRAHELAHEGNVQDPH